MALLYASDVRYRLSNGEQGCQSPVPEGYNPTGFSDLPGRQHFPLGSPLALVKEDRKADWMQPSSTGCCLSTGYTPAVEHHRKQLPLMEVLYHSLRLQHAASYTAVFLSPLLHQGQVKPRGPELLGQLQEHDPRAVHCAWGAEGPDGTAQ